MGWIKRRRVWVDPPFQGRLVLRVFLYCLAFLFTFTHVAFLYDLLTNMPEALNRGMISIYKDYFSRQVPFFVASLFILPAMLYDAVKFSNRVAGPLYRCRKVMKAMTSGKPVTEFKVRKNDLLKEHVDALNALIKKWNEIQGNSPRADGQPDNSAETLLEEAVPAVAGSQPGALVH